MGHRGGARNSLERLGLLNRESPDLGELITNSKRIYKAYCTSYKCCHIEIKKNGRIIKQDCATRKLKDVKDRDTSLCPDCGHVLLWKTAYIPN